MTVYTSQALSPSAWPALMETVYQALPASGKVPAGARRPGITQADRLFASAVVAIPREERYGAVTWMAQAFATSRQTIYDIAASTQRRLEVMPAPAQDRSVVVAIPHAPAVTGTAVARGALTLLFPGGVTLRPMRVCLDELLGEPRSPAWLCTHFNQAGRRAGEVLAAADWSAMAPFIATRDEKFFDGRAYLLTIDPKSLTVVSGHVEDGVDSECWGVSLALDQLKTGGAIIGLAEDAANWYPASLAAAANLAGSPWLMPVQKDVFHVLDRAYQTLTDVERLALGKLATAEKMAKRRQSGLWVIRDLAGYKAAHQAADAAVQVAQDVHFWVHCLHDALELVEPRSGEIRDPDTAGWYLDEILAGLATIDDRRVTKLAAYITNQKAQLFTFLGWLDVALAPWRTQADTHFGDRELVQLFERAVARAWRLRHAADTGARRLRRAAQRAEAHVASLCQHDPGATYLAGELAAILEMTVRTSSASECVNSVLELYIDAHKSFQGRVSAQYFLNLFVLWHGLRRFERGKRRGQSPFKIAGVRVFDPDGNETDDWLAALGYPKAA